MLFEEKNKISIVLLVEDAESYINRCIDTILNQKYKNIEVIAVDLCSEDNSYKILEEYSKKDERIKIYKDELIPSLALTKAVERCSGEFITIVRIEDYIEENYLIDMVSLMSEDTNIAVSNFVKYKSEDNVFYFENINSEGNKVHKYEINNLKEVSENNRFILESMFGKLYKASILKAIGYLTLNEEEIMKWLYCKTDNIALCNNSSYVYRVYLERYSKLLPLLDYKEEKLISVISPVYNAEKYLEECLNSIINQSYRNLEIILVNDGSTDNSLAICEKYAEKDERIKVVTKENGGASSSRNYGLDISKGEFVYFIDSDDWIDLDTIRLLYNQQKIHNSDIVFGNYLNYRENDRRYEFYILDDKFTIKRFSPSETLINQSNSDFNTANFIVVHNKLINKDLFNNIRFVEGKIFEDEAIMHKLFIHANSSLLININNYYYRVRSNSVMTSGFDIKNVASLLEIIDEKLSDFALFTRGENMVDVVNRVYRILRHYKGLMEHYNYQNHELYYKIIQKMKFYELGE